LGAPVRPDIDLQEVNACHRRATENGGPPLLALIFENFWTVTLAIADRLEADFEFCDLPAPDCSLASVVLPMPPIGPDENESPASYFGRT